MTLTAQSTAPVCVPSRPALHFTPAQGWMNDPNGLVYFEGEYHLFYQYYPQSQVWGPMHWGHAISTDLLHWEHLPTALFPDQQGMCFSGSAIVDQQDSSGLFDGQPGLLAFYTTHLVTGSGDKDYVQEQCIAYSRDRGRSWQKYAGNPVIASPGFADFRDPKVIWHAATNAWIMAVSCGQTIRFYRSDNLLDWTLASEFGADQGRHTPGPWECPDLFELQVEGGEGSRWVLLVGVGAGDDDWGSFTQYFVGHFDGYRFHNENAADCVLLMDESRDFYAAQTWSDTLDGRRLAIGWLNNWLYANQIPESGWRGAMSVPRELRLVQSASGVRLAQRFVAELGQRPAQTLPQAAPGHLVAGQQLSLEPCASPAQGLLSLSLAEDARIALYLLQGEQPDLVLERTQEGVTLRHLRTGANGVAAFDRYFPHDFSLALGAAERVELEWLVDAGSLELLINDGLHALTSIHFQNLSALAPTLKVEQGEVNLAALDYRAV